MRTVVGIDRRRVLAVVVGGCAHSRDSGASEVIEAVYPRMPERPIDAYGYRLLKLALEASGRPFRLSLTPEDLPSVRAFRRLQSGNFNVMDAGAALRLAREARMLPFPLDLGLSGYRLALVRRDRLDRLGKVRHLSDLTDVSFGQGPDWTDAHLLRSAGLKVQEAEFLSLFKMLEAGRFDAFPLGADEAEDLLGRFQHLAPSAVVLRDWCLHYPYARLLIVNHGNDALYDALHDGLTRVFSDGRARALLARDARLGPWVTGQRQLPSRIIQVPNPDWTAVFRAIPQSLFFTPR